jgi:hypothetical protein
MTTRHFQTGDAVTDYNLRRLEHLSTNDGRDGELHLFDIHIHATIDSYEMLPAGARRHFAINPYVGDYDQPGDAWWAKTWVTLAAGLEAGLQAVVGDPALTKDGGADLSDRPPSRGDELAAACRKFEEAFDHGRGWEGPLAEMERLGSGTSARSDAKEIRRQLGKRRVRDVSAWRSEIIRLVWRAKHTAQNMHHLRGYG